MWYTFFIISVACLLLIPIMTLILEKTRLFKKIKLSFFYSLYLAVGFSTFFMFVPVNFSNSDGSLLANTRELLSTFSRAMVVFGGGCDEKVINASLQYCPDGFGVAYQILGELLSILGPILAVGFVLSFFSNLTEKLKVLVSYFDDVYVFSELNEKSLLLASDIVSDKNDKSRREVIFANVADSKKEDKNEFSEKAKNLGAICLKKSITDINFNKHSKKRRITFFAMSENETENLNVSLKLIERYKKRSNTDLYVFSIKKDCEIVLSAVDKAEMKVRRINEVRSNVYNNLYESGELLFDSARDNEYGTKTISAVVIGFGRYGLEYLKALSWYCQMDGYRLEINAFDKSKTAKARLEALAPDLLNPEYNGKELKGEAQYQINVHSDVDVETKTFYDMINQIKNATYVVISLGNDEANINLALELRAIFERMNIHPIINAVVYNPDIKKNIVSLKNYRGDEYDINLIGEITKTYSKKVIINSALEEAGRKVHMKYDSSKEKDYWNYEYCYSSSIASAIHKKARIHCGIRGAEKEEKDLTIEERDIIEPLEHRRWNAYMRSIGYVYNEKRNDLAKTHYDLIAFERLSKEEKRKDSKVATE